MQKAVITGIFTLLLLTGCTQKEGAVSGTGLKAISVKLAPFNFIDSPDREDSKKMAMEYGDGDSSFMAGSVLHAYGTWLSRSPLAYPTHTVDINCIRNEDMEPYAHDRNFPTKGLCIVAKATLDKKDNYLAANTNFYDIEKWTFDEVVASGGADFNGCFEELLTLDRQNQQVTLVRKTLKTASQNEMCKGMEEAPLLMSLGDGWKVEAGADAVLAPNMDDVLANDKMSKQEKDEFYEKYGKFISQ